MHRKSLQIILVVMVFTGLSACGAPLPSEPTVTTMDEGAIQTAAVQTFIAEITASAPTETPLPSPTVTSLPTATLTPTQIPEPTLTPIPTVSEGAYYKVLNSDEAAQLLPTYIAFYLVYPLDPENCSYTMRPILALTYPQRTGDVVADVTTALNLLFQFSLSNMGVFTNPLLPASHKLVNITVSGSSMAVYLTGDPARTDNRCTNHQMRDQIFTTIRQIAKDFGINDIVPYLDTNLYDDYMIGE